MQLRTRTIIYIHGFYTNILGGWNLRISFQHQAPIISSKSGRWWHLAEGLTASCFELWASSPTGLAPEFSKAPTVGGTRGSSREPPVDGEMGGVPNQVSPKAPHKFAEDRGFSVEELNCLKLLAVVNLLDQSDIRWYIESKTIFGVSQASSDGRHSFLRPETVMS